MRCVNSDICGVDGICFTQINGQGFCSGKPKNMIYYIEIKAADGEIVAGELETKVKLSQKGLIQKVMEFAKEHGICPSYAISNCKWRLK